MPHDYHNWLNRHLGPVAKKLRIRVNHQILRRTYASLAHNTGGDLKDIQGHSSPVAALEREHYRQRIHEAHSQKR